MVEQKTRTLPVVGSIPTRKPNSLESSCFMPGKLVVKVRNSAINVCASKSVLRKTLGFKLLQGSVAFECAARLSIWGCSPHLQSHLLLIVH